MSYKTWLEEEGGQDLGDQGRPSQPGSSSSARTLCRQKNITSAKVARENANRKGDMGGTVMEDCFLLPPSSFSSSWSNLSKRREAREVRLLIKPGQVPGLLTCLLITRLLPGLGTHDRKR